VFAGTERIDMTPQEVKKFSEYFLSLGENQKIDLPIKLATTQVKHYSFMSGIHRVSPKENESMLAIFVNIVVDGKKVNSIFYRFTITPRINDKLLDKKDLNWNTILSKSKLTQYLIEEKEEKGNSVYKKTLLKINKK
jgi:hypothetical protein